MPSWSVHTVSLHEQPELWERLLAASPDASVFSGTAWLTTLAQTFRKRALGFVVSSDGEPRAGIPLLLHRRGPLRLAAPLPITLYAGLIRTVADASLLDPLLRMIERRLHFVVLSATMSEAERELLHSHGWRVRSQQTLRISLQDPEALWNGYNQSLRRKIRRAEEAGLQLDADPPSGEIIRMYEQSYFRHGNLPPIPGKTLEAWLGALRARSIVRCFSARHADGRCAAVRVVLRSGDTLYDWLAGADPAVIPSASHWLVHAILRKFSQEGCLLFDFMGANTPGVTDFKRSFGGVIHEYHEAEWYRPGILRHIGAWRGRRIRMDRGYR